MNELINKTDNTTLNNGCLSYLKNHITFGLPQNLAWADNPQKLISYSSNHHVRNDPYSQPPSWISFGLGGYLIRPTSYSLEGRRQSSAYLLQSWELLGKTTKNEWKRLHYEDNLVIRRTVVMNFQISSNEYFSEFRVNMTNTDSGGKWALCIGQIEIFGYISHSLTSIIPMCESHRLKHNLFHFHISTLLVFIL